MNGTSESRNLDLLRTTAVAFVVLFHLLLFFRETKPDGIDLHSIGHFGVLLFFVHTSIVLMYSLERQAGHTSASRLFGSFYTRRFFRIYPLSVLVVLGVYLLHLPLAHLQDGSFLSVHLNRLGLLANLFLVQNITHTDSIIAPLWSLPYEMQLYLLLPLLFLLARASRSIFTLNIFWIVSVLAAESVQHVHRYQVPDLLDYVPCFAAGVIAYKLAESRTLNLPFFGWPLVLAALTTLYLYNPTVQRGWFCCLLLALAIPQFREMRPGPLHKICHKISQYSYGIYLTHFAAIWLSFVDLHSFPLALQWLVFVVTLVALPILLYHTVESPMIAFGRKWAASWSARNSSESQAPLKLSY